MGRRLRAANSGEAQNPPVIPAGAHPRPSFRPGATPTRHSGRTHPLPVISTERSERRNPAGDGRRADAGACGVDGASSGFLHSAPARRAGASVEMTGEGRNDGRWGGGCAPPLRATRNTHPSFRPNAPPPRHFGRAQPPPVISTERSEWRNPAGDGRRADARACGVDGAPSGFLRSAPARRAGAPVEMTGVGRNDGRGGGGCAPPLRAKRNIHPSFRPERTLTPSFRPGATPSRHFDRAERVEKSGRGRAPGGCRSLRRRWSARRVSPLRLRSGQATPPRPGGPWRRSK